MNNNEHLPVYGPGPVIGGVMVIITIAACFMRNLPGLETGRLDGVLLDIGVSSHQLDSADRGFSWKILDILPTVLNAGEKAGSLTEEGAKLIDVSGKIPLFFWAFMTVVLKNTEEKWLKDLYGNEYTEYCRMVNRCWLWIPKK